MEARAISFEKASLATIAHTSIVYAAPVLGLSQIPIARLLGEGTLPKAQRGWQTAFGFVEHFALGAVLFPFAYNVFARYFLPKRQPKSDLAWALLLWCTGQNLVIPALRKSDLFKKHPDAIATYLLAHIVYGVICAHS